MNDGQRPKVTLNITTENQGTKLPNVEYLSQHFSNNNKTDTRTYNGVDAKLCCPGADTTGNLSIPISKAAFFRSSSFF